MKKIFNVNGDCKPELHYMVDLGERLQQIKEMVDAGRYFTINKARQYGKTTTLRALERFLANAYTVVSLDFQLVSYADFEKEEAFVMAFAREVLDACEGCNDMADGIAEELEAFAVGKIAGATLSKLFRCFQKWCRQSEKKIVLMIDEVDSASNNQIFLDFLAQLRGGYINRDRKPTFQSVILAGVYDVKNIKRKIRSEDDHKMNSPWNTHVGNEENGSLLTFDDCPWDQKEATPFDIAAEFSVDMSFSARDIEGMLEEYEQDNGTGMDIPETAKRIYEYTSGYPFLVSCLCKLMDERIAESAGFSDERKTWTKEGFLEAVKILLTEPNTLFDSLFNKLEDYPELDRVLRSLLFEGKEIPYVLEDRPIEMAMMFGFVRRSGNSVVVANRIFETLLYNFFLISGGAQQERIYDEALKDKNQFLKKGRLDMQLVLEKFVSHFDELYGDRGQAFYEEDGRRYFLLYLRPIINGSGHYYVEAQTRNRERTDIVVDYGGEQFVIELKVWRGDAYNTRGEQQLLDYLSHYHLQKGYMLIFNFNKKKTSGVREVTIDGKVLIEATV
ncbi:MAG: AAA-like domain-containing protein [Eubacteriales bacterium]|nr:AAA-like domain-containing protein [Eubacteriales bacterium]